MKTLSEAIETQSCALESAQPSVDRGAFVAATLPAVVELTTKLSLYSKAPRVIAFTALAHGAGVTSVIGLLATALERDTHRRPAVVQASDIMILGKTSHVAGGARSEGPSARATSLNRLLAESDCVLIDCEPMSVSAELARIASITDGVVLVLEAGFTRKKQVDRAVATIRAAGGTCLGVVLNKRKYPIPGWLYRFIG